MRNSEPYSTSFSLSRENGAIDCVFSLPYSHFPLAPSNASLIPLHFFELLIPRGSGNFLKLFGNHGQIVLDQPPPDPSSNTEELLPLNLRSVVTRSDFPFSSLARRRKSALTARLCLLSFSFSSLFILLLHRTSSQNPAHLIPSDSPT